MQLLITYFLLGVAKSLDLSPLFPVSEGVSLAYACSTCVETFIQRSGCSIPVNMNEEELDHSIEELLKSINCQHCKKYVLLFCLRLQDHSTMHTGSACGSSSIVPTLLDEERNAQMFAMIDTNDDEFISLIEIQLCKKDVRNSIFTFDCDNDGKLTEEELLPFVSFIDDDVLEEILAIRPSIHLMTNQGIFSIDKNNNVSSEHLFDKRNTIHEILAKTSSDPTATLKKAWFRRMNFLHHSLFIQFSDGKCEQIEWIPTNYDITHEVLGEHSTGSALLHYDVEKDHCYNTSLFYDLPDSPTSLLTWLHNSMDIGDENNEIDLARWTSAYEKETNQHITRDQFYKAFLKEANRFKDEDKYSCTTFINNVFKLATNHEFVNPEVMIQTIKIVGELGVAVRGKFSPPSYTVPTPSEIAKAMKEKKEKENRERKEEEARLKEYYSFRT